METKVITIDTYDFLVEYSPNGYKYGLGGSVVEIQNFGDGWEYRDNESSGTTTSRNRARVLFDWSMAWRGVWEGRIYFKDDEYWAEELEIMTSLWKEISIFIKNKIDSQFINRK